MIKVLWQRNNEKISQISIKGHALAAYKGNDLVCAGVSCIVTGIANAIEELVGDSCTITLASGLSSFVVNNDSEKLQTILKTMMYQLATLAETYPKNVIIKEEVV